MSFHFAQTLLNVFHLLSHEKRSFMLTIEGNSFYYIIHMWRFLNDRRSSDLFLRAPYYIIVDFFWFSFHNCNQLKNYLNKGKERKKRGDGKKMNLCV